VSQDAQLFKTPSIETHLLASTAVEVDRALEVLNEEGGFPVDAEGLALLASELVARFSIQQPPAMHEANLTFHNDRNQLLSLLIPIIGNIYFLTYQVRSLPSPAFVGQIHMEGEAGTIAISYKFKDAGRAWETNVDGDLAMLRTYISSIAAAITTFNGMLPALIETKIKETLSFNQLRRDIADKMAKRGFREI
jgi:hypothetical protein